MWLITHAKICSHTSVVCELESVCARGGRCTSAIKSVCVSATHGILHPDVCVCERMCVCVRKILCVCRPHTEFYIRMYVCVERMCDDATGV